MTNRAFKSRELTRIARISARQLQWWTEKRFVLATMGVGRDQGGRQWFYPAKEVLLAYTLARLKRQNATLRQIRPLSDRIRKELLGASLERRYLIVGLEPRKVRLLEKPAAVLNAYRHTHCGLCLVDLAEAVRAIEGIDRKPEKQDRAPLGVPRREYQGDAAWMR